MLVSANNLEEVAAESEYYTSGQWFQYNTKEGSNILENEKELKGIKFPEVAKERAKKIDNGKNWISTKGDLRS